MLVVQIDTRQIAGLAAAYAELGEKRMFLPLRRALNKIGDRAYTQIVRTVSEESGAQQKRVRHILKKYPAKSGLIWKAVARDGYMSLKDFKPRQTSAGVKHSAWGGGVARGAFIVDSLGGHVYKRVEGVKRVMSKGRYKGKTREPIKKLWGPALPVQMIRGKTDEVLNQVVAQYFLPEALRQVEREFVMVAKERIAGAGKKGAAVGRIIRAAL